MKKDDKAPGLSKQVYEVPASGSLGLLALGYRGLVAWRAALKKYREENPEADNDGKKKS